MAGLMSATQVGPAVNSAAVAQQTGLNAVALKNTVGAATGLEEVGEDGKKRIEKLGAWDREPFVQAHSNAAEDEAFRDMVSLQPYFGGNKLMGQKPFDRGMLEYLAKKRNITQDKAWMDCKSSSSAFCSLAAANRRR
jgi:hypothetical protein